MKSSRIRYFINKLDLFGVRPEFSINAIDKYRTLTGTCISFIIYLIIFSGLFFFGKELVLKKEPTVITSEFFQDNPSEFKLNSNNFGFFIGIQDKDGMYFYDDTLFEFEMNLKTTNKVINATTGHLYDKTDLKKLDLEPCNITKHFPKFQQQFSINNGSKIFCMKSNRDNKVFEYFPLEGTWGEEIFKYLELNVKFCNSTNNNNCKSDIEIRDKLLGGYFVVNFIDTIFQPGNYNQPYKYVKRDFYTSFSSKYFKEVAFYYKNVNYTTDEGFILQDPITNNHLSIDYITQNIDFEKKSQIFIQSVFRMSYNMDLHSRIYIKVQDVIAQVGGLVEGIFMIVEFFYSSYAESKYFYNFAETKFSLEEDDGYSRSKPIIPLFTDGTKINSVTGIYKTKLYNKVNENKFSSVISVLNKPKNLTKFTRFKFICFKWFLNKKDKIKCNAWERLIEDIYKQLDIKNLLTYYQEIEQFKDLFLTEDQRIIFESIPIKDKLRKKKENILSSGILMNSFDKLSMQDSLSRNLKQKFMDKFGFNIQYSINT